MSKTAYSASFLWRQTLVSELNDIFGVSVFSMDACHVVLTVTKVLLTSSWTLRYFFWASLWSIGISNRRGVRQDAAQALDCF